MAGNEFLESAAPLSAGDRDVAEVTVNEVLERLALPRPVRPELAFHKLGQSRELWSGGVENLATGSRSRRIVG